MPPTPISVLTLSWIKAVKMYLLTEPTAYRLPTGTTPMLKQSHPSYKISSLQKAEVLEPHRNNISGAKPSFSALTANFDLLQLFLVIYLSFDGGKEGCG